MTKDEALKLALEALEGVLDDSPKVMDASVSGGLYEVVQCRDAITAIKKALAQPEPFKPDYDTEAVLVEEMQRMAKRIEDLEVEQEPVAWMTRDDGDGLWYSTNFKKSDDDKPLYASPPKRQPLTDTALYEMMYGKDFIQFARAIEQAHDIGDKP